MILFEKDWEDYPDAIVDTKTKNTSFIHYAGLLKTMGVQNHKWPLQLLDPRLQGVDPRSPNLELKEIGWVLAESKSNYFYFIREAMIIPGSDEMETILFQANRGNMAMYWLFFCHVVPYVVMIRQSGKSFGMDTLDVWHLNIRLYFANISLVTKDETLRSANMKRIKDIEETLPWYMKTRNPKDPANSEEYRVSKLKNVLRAHLANKSEKIARNLGRGLTDQITRFDELAYLYNIAISLPAAMAAGVAARDRARRRGDPYGAILATTAGKKDDRDGSYAFGLLMDSAPWSESLMDARDEENLHLIVKNSSRSEDLMVIASFVHSQLGKSDEWLRQAIRETKAVGEDAERDFGNVWTSGSLSSPIGPKLSAIVRASEQKDPYVEIDDNFGYAIRWYVPETHIEGWVKQRWTTISLDTSDAIGNDDIGLVIRDNITGGIVAVGDYNEINLFEFSKFIFNLMMRLNLSVMVPESRSSARTIMDYVIVRMIENGVNPFLRIYNTIVQNADTNPEEFNLVRGAGGLNIHVVNSKKKAFGFATSASGETARSTLYGRVLKSWATYCGRMAHDSRLINQVLSLVIRNGRIDHAVAGHDDLCMSNLLGHWFLIFGRNLHLYGIPTGTVLSVIDSGDKELSQVDRYRNYVNERLRQEIRRLGEQMQAEPDENIAARIASKIRAIHGGMSTEESKSFSVSDFLQQINERRAIEFAL